MSYTSQVVEDPQALSALAPAWRRLSQASAPNLFTDLDWFAPWWEAFAEPGDRLALLLVQQGGALVGLAPLMIPAEPLGALLPPAWARRAAPLLPPLEVAWRRAGARRWRAAFNHYSGRTEFLVHPAHPGALPALLAALAEQQGRWDVLELPWVPQDGPLYAALAQGTGGFRVHAVESAASPYLELAGDFAGYYQRRFSAKTRSRDRQALREAERLGGFALEHLSGPAALGDRLQEIFALEDLGWKGAAGSAMGQHPRIRRFMQEVARRFAARDALSLVRLELAGRPAAFVLGFLLAGVYYYFKTSFDPAHEALRPGRMVTNKSLEVAFALGARRFDFLGAADEYKLRYTDQARVHATVFLYHRGARSRALRELKRSLTPLGKELFERGRRSRVLIDR